MMSPSLKEFFPMHEGAPSDSEIAVGGKIECGLCGETLVRVTADHEGRGDDYREVATDQEHECWTQLPEGAEHMRLD